MRFCRTAWAAHRGIGYALRVEGEVRTAARPALNVLNKIAPSKSCADAGPDIQQVVGKWDHCDAKHTHRTDRGEITAIVYDGGHVAGTNQTRYGHPGAERGLTVMGNKFTVEISVRLRKQHRTDGLGSNKGIFTVSLVAQRYMAAEESRVDMAIKLAHHSKCENYFEPKNRRNMVQTPGGPCVGD